MHKFFRQRSRVCWKDVGDMNTGFHHKTAIQHSSRNHIHYIRDEDDRFLETITEIKAHFVAYCSGITSGSLALQMLRDAVHVLEKKCVPVEIICTIKSMPMNKSLGPDGYPVEILRVSWDTVGNDVVSAIMEFFQNGRMLKDMNTTNICHIPKTGVTCSWVISYL